VRYPRPLIVSLALLASLQCRPSAKSEVQTGRQVAATPQVAARSASSCPGFLATPVTVSADSIGPIPLDSPLSVAARLCPNFRPADDYLETTKILDWTFDINGVQASATQFGTDIDTSKRAEEWIVSGYPVLVPGKVPLPPTWGELRKHYDGPAKLRLGELGPIANICALPGLRFALSFPYTVDDRDTMTAVGIPVTATIERILIWRSDPSDTTTSC
jgi:hypothetical protein